MKIITRDKDKNEQIKKRYGMGGIGFEEIYNEIILGKILARLPNDSLQHEGQQMFIVAINDYPIKIPFIERNNEIHLITAFPAGKYKYLLNKH